MNETSNSSEWERFAAWFERSEGFAPMRGDSRANDLFAAFVAATVPPAPAANATAICQCAHPKSDHRWMRDHDECDKCTGRDDPCTEFRLTEMAAPADWMREAPPSCSECGKPMVYDKGDHGNREEAEQRESWSCADCAISTEVKYVSASPSSDYKGRAAARGIYVASRASLPERGEMWRTFRADGVPITSSWIDEDGEGESESLADLWLRISTEISNSGALVLYAEEGDFPLKGAYIEAGIALGQGKRIVVCLPDVTLDSMSLRPIGSWVTHPLVQRCDDIEKAVKIALGCAALSAAAPAPVGSDAETIAETIVDDLFGNSDRLILSDAGEDKGRSRWARLVVKDRIVDVLKAALVPPSPTADAMLRELRERYPNTSILCEIVDDTDMANMVRVYFSVANLRIRGKGETLSEALVDARAATTAAKEDNLQ